MFRNRSILLIGAALILVAVLATVTYLRLNLPTAPASIPVAAVVVEDVALEPVGNSQVAARSVYVSEQTLKWIVDEAENHRWDARADAAWHTLNARHEHRCCGLPR